MDQQTTPSKRDDGARSPYGPGASGAWPCIDPSACAHCLEGQTPHEDWHSTRAEYLRAGADLTRRVREREHRAVVHMPDVELMAYGQQMRRLAVTAAEDDWPDFARDLVAEWVQGAEKEWRWRRRAATLGADPVMRSAGTWPERVERVKRAVDLLTLIGADTTELRPRGAWKFTCRCPFHEDRHPSLDGDTEKGVWLCRACGIGGDAIRYVELREGLSFGEAVQALEARLGLMPPEREIRGVPVAVARAND